MAVWIFYFDFYVGEFIIALFIKKRTIAEVIELGERKDIQKESATNYWTKVRYQIDGDTYTANIIRDKKDYIGKKIILAYDSQKVLYRKGIKCPYCDSMFTLFYRLYISLVGMIPSICIVVVIFLEKSLWFSTMVIMLVLVLINLLTLKAQMRYFYKSVN